MKLAEAKYYGISTGNGNDGVSQLFPDYIVKTDEPYRLAELAALAQFNAGEGREWAKENWDIDGEAEYTISVTFYESPEQQEERDEAEKRGENTDDYGTDYAWFIVEVYPWEGDLPERRPIYDSLADCFEASELADVEPEAEPTTYKLVVDLNERGSFRAHVENYKGEEVFSYVGGDELADDETDLAEDGFLRHLTDKEGLTLYLIDLKVIPHDSTID